MATVRRAMVVALAPLLLALVGALGAAAASQAEMRVTAPAGVQQQGTPFDVTLAISRADVQWAGYNFQLAYDPSVVKVDSVKREGIADCKENSWANPQNTPTIITACVFQTTQATGNTETITFECLKDGRTKLHLVTPSEDNQQPSGLFNEEAVAISADLVDAEVTCGAGGPLQTVAIPTNPTSDDIKTANAGFLQTVTAKAGTSVAQGTPATTPVPFGGPGQVSSPGPGSTSSSGSPAAGTTGTSGTPAVTKSAAAARTGTAAAGATGSSSSSGSDNNWVIWTVIGAVVVAALAAGGGVLFWRRRNAV